MNAKEISDQLDGIFTFKDKKMALTSFQFNPNWPWQELIGPLECDG